MSKTPATDLETIKRLVIVAMFSDDELMDRLVVKGGNALDIVYQIGTRASIDVDFSMKDDFPAGQDEFRSRAERALKTTLGDVGLAVFDVKLEERPKVTSEDVADFWGGYTIEFKLIAADKYTELENDLEALRRSALMLGQGTRFIIDISKFEFVAAKEEHIVEGHRIFVYSAAMLVCEKLRAVCQQMPEYAAVVHRGRPSSARARDFVDIHSIVGSLSVDMTLPENKGLLAPIFDAKRVPLELLDQLPKHRDFHRGDFPAVEATLKPGVVAENFDFYFDFVLDLIEKLKPFRNE